MTQLDKIMLALQGVGSNKFRSFLTLLGIIIGVGAVILMVSLGSGTQKVVGGQFSSLNTRQIYLSSNWNLPYNQRGRLAEDDVNLLERSILGVKEVVPFYNSYLPVKFNDKERENTVAGILPSALELVNLEIKYGRNITGEDLNTRKRLALVSEDFLEQMTEDDDYASFIGEEIIIDGNKLIIGGILASSSSTVGLPGNSILIPLTTYEEFWRHRVDHYSFCLVTYENSASESDIIAQIKYILDKRYGQSNGESRFLTQGLEGQTEVMRRVITVFTYVLGGIAAISLLVGGIGVMNIMLVTVKERTREIGVRRAIGATQSDIQLQFLLEAIVLSIGGGVLGIIAGGSLAMLINTILKQNFDWWQGSIPLWIIILSFGVTVFIGLVFGFYPAYKASKLDPIEALRYE